MIKSALFNELKTRFKGELLEDELYRAIYATDASVYQMNPLGVAFPKDENDLQEIVKWAGANQISLIPRAAGTSLAGQCVGEGVVVDTSRHLTKILEFDEKAKRIRVQPGVIRDELNSYLKPYGLFFGPNTSTANRCTIGGMVGNNSSGTTSIRYGVTRDKIAKLRAVLADGSIHEFGEESPSLQKSKQGKVIEERLLEMLSREGVKEQVREHFPKAEIHRRNTGYAIDVLINDLEKARDTQHCNVAKLLCGSEGTLAFTSEIELRLDEIPPAYGAMVVTHYDSLEGCLSDVETVMKHTLYTCEMMDKVILDCTKGNKLYSSARDFVVGDPEALLMLEVRAHSAEDLARQVSELIDFLKQQSSSYASPVLEGDSIQKAHELRKAGLGLLGQMIGDEKAVACIEDTAVAPSDLKPFIMEFSALMKRYGQRAVYYAHAGAGELHLRPILNLKKSEDVVLFRSITTDVMYLTKKYKGSFSGEHGDGIVRAEFLPELVGEDNYALFKEIKQLFDPQGLFNPGKIVNPYPMDKALRYEPDRQEPKLDTFLDFSDSQGYLRAVEQCNGSGDCRKTEEAHGGMCPSYHGSRDEKDTTRARANALRMFITQENELDAFSHEEVVEALDLCLSCKACASECPSNVDMATLKAEYLFQYQEKKGYSLRSRFFAYSTSLNKLASNAAWLANGLFKSPLSYLIKSFLGVASKRSLPKVYSVDYQRFYSQLPKPDKPIKEVVLYIDEFSKYLDASLVKSAIEVLNKLGYRLHLVYAESGRAFISKGFLRQAKQCAAQSLKSFKSYLDQDLAIIGLEPSAVLSFRDEYIRLLPEDPLVKKLATQSFLIEEFLVDELKEGCFTSEAFTEEARSVKVHVHCHQKAHSNQKITFDLLNAIPNYQVTLMPTGCCGMAGSFGYEKEHYDLSMRIGELKLFKAVRKAPLETLIVANGTSCRHQIKDGTKRMALHPVEVLAQALRS